MLLLNRQSMKQKMDEIRNDYVSTDVLDSRLNDLKSQHIADEVKKN